LLHRPDAMHVLCKRPAGVECEEGLGAADENYQARKNPSDTLHILLTILVGQTIGFCRLPFLGHT
jgi:hypothetical protein